MFVLPVVKVWKPNDGRWMLFVVDCYVRFRDLKDGKFISTLTKWKVSRFEDVDASCGSWSVIANIVMNAACEGKLM
ncbi:MAG: hypothetical protein ACTS5F_01515 [Candidatus Hodgkinia cicadicola]